MFLKEKFKADGSFDKMKARLAALGNEEEASLFTEDSSSPTANIMSILILIAISVQYGCSLETDDVPGAYLHAPLPENRFIFLKLPNYVSKIWCEKEELIYEQVKDGKNNVYIKLQKALYGLKESGLLWFELFMKELQKLSYYPTPSDPCVLAKWRDGKFHFIAIYVDDMLHVSNDQNMILDVRSYLERRFGSLGSQKGPKLSFLSINIEIIENQDVSKQLYQRGNVKMERHLPH